VPGVHGGLGEPTAATQEKMTATKNCPQLKLVGLLACLGSHCWRVYFCLGLKLIKPVSKSNYRP
jgi:hypothetical protein